MPIAAAGCRGDSRREKQARLDACNLVAEGVDEREVGFDIARPRLGEIEAIEQDRRSAQEV